jgi:hypothetical protein
MAPRPAIAPLTIPIELGIPLAHEMKSHARAPDAAEIFVTTIAFTASPFAASALPPLNPNHPNQSRAAPRSVIGMLWGSIEYSPKPARFPMTSARASAANPALDVDDSPSGKVKESKICEPSAPPRSSERLVNIFFKKGIQVTMKSPFMNEAWGSHWK